MKVNLQQVRSGKVTVTPESDDDLWVLSQVIFAGDRARSTTYRKIKIGDAGTDRNVKVIRKPMRLTIEVEKTEFTESALRLLGTIRDGPEDVNKGDHHSFTVESSQTVDIFKDQWPHYLIDKIKEAAERQDTIVIICVFDREGAIFAKASWGGYTILSSVRGNMPKKTDADHVSSDFYGEVASQIKEYCDRYGANTVVLGSAAFWQRYLKEKMDDSIKLIASTVNDVGEKGVAEVMSRPEIKNALSQARFADEMEAVESLLAAIATDRPVAYGVDDCRTAAQAGAIQTLLVSETYMHQQRLEGDVAPIEHVLALAEQTGAQIMFIGRHEAGKKIAGLGGLAAKLRYALG